jgi:hypothetical protein
MRTSQETTVNLRGLLQTNKQKAHKLLGRKRPIQAERPSLAGEVNSSFWDVSHGQRN